MADSSEDFDFAKWIESLSNPRTRQVMYEITSSIGHVPLRPDDSRPPWAIKSYQEFFRSSGILPADFFGGEKAPNENKNLGYAVGMLPAFDLNELKSSPQLFEMFELLLGALPQVRQEASQFPPIQAADFFEAQKDGNEKAEELNQVPQRSKIFLLIAVLWELVAELKSTTELHLWLLSLKRGDNDQFILARSTDSREIRRVCDIIGLRYDNPGGRPLKN